jgi:hypothetical protein
MNRYKVFWSTRGFDPNSYHNFLPNIVTINQTTATLFLPHLSCRPNILNLPQNVASHKCGFYLTLGVASCGWQPNNPLFLPHCRPNILNLPQNVASHKLGCSGVKKGKKNLDAETYSKVGWRTKSKECVNLHKVTTPYIHVKCTPKFFYESPQKKFHTDTPWIEIYTIQYSSPLHM